MAIIGFGSDFLLSTDGGSTYNSAGQIQEITLPTFKVTKVDTSNIQMANRWRSKIGGLIEGDVLKFKLLFDKTKYNTIFTNLQKANNFKVVFSDLGSTASTLVFAGYYSELGGTMPLDNMVLVDISVEVSGIPTFTAGT